MPVVRTVPSTRSRKHSVSEPIINEDDDGSEGDLELLYPNSDTEPDSTSTAADAGPAPPVPAGASHSPKRSAGHIPRPPNCYILFRSNYCVENKKLGSKAELDHRVVSKMASIAWNALSHADKKPWEDRAREKKIEHAQNYPGYSYSPASRSGGKGGKRKASDDGDYDDHTPQPKRCRCKRTSAANSQDAGSSLPLVSSPDEEFPLALTARSAAPSPEPKTPTLSPNSSSSPESPIIRTPTMTLPDPQAPDDDFVPTKDIPPLYLSEVDYSEKIEASKLERSQRPSSLNNVEPQFFKAAVSSQARDSCMWYPYTNDGTYSKPAVVASTSSDDEFEPDVLPPINYDAVQFTNPFRPFESEMSEFSDRTWGERQF